MIVTGNLSAKGVSGGAYRLCGSRMQESEKGRKSGRGLEERWREASI